MQTILIADDDAAVRSALALRLRHQGYAVHEARSGQAAVGLFETHEPDLLILDASMPDMSGFEVCHQIREVDRTRRVPVIILSGVCTPSLEYVTQCASVMDADAFVAKPYQAAELLDLVRTTLTAQPAAGAC